MNKSHGKNFGRKRSVGPQHTEATPYEVMEIPETASFEEIRKAYIKKVRSSPPEKDPAGFKAVRKAYGLLKDSENRKTLDLSIFRKSSGIDIGIDINEDYESDFALIFKDMIFQLLLTASDFYIKDFGMHFKEIDGEIRKLQ